MFLASWQSATYLIRVDKKKSKPKKNYKGMQIFGGDLNLLVKDGQLPSIIQDIVNEIIKRGLKVEGIFRKSPVQSEVLEMKNIINAGMFFNISNYDPIALAALFKLFLRELALPVLPKTVFPALSKISSLHLSQERLVCFVKDEVLILVPSDNLLLLKTISFLSKNIVEHSQFNLMTCSNLAVVMAPNIIRAENAARELELQNATQSVFRIMVEAYDTLFI